MMFDGLVRLLHNVRYVLSLKKNIIFIGILKSMGCVMKVYGGVIKVIKDAMIMMKGTLRANGLYIMKGHTTDNVAAIVDTKMVSSSKSWY